MPRFRAIIAILLVVAQGFAALGLGPRAICEDPDGASCTDSAAAPCCCIAHHKEATACCDDDGAGGGGARAAHQTHSAHSAAVGGGPCGCRHTPIPGRPIAALRAASASDVSHAVDAPPAPAFFSAPGPALLDGAWAVALAGGGRPRHGRSLDHLNSIILRL